MNPQHIHHIPIDQFSGSGMIAVKVAEAKASEDTDLHKEADTLRKYHTVQQLISFGAQAAAAIDMRRAEFMQDCDEIAAHAFGFSVFGGSDDYDLKGRPWVGFTPIEFLKDAFGEEFTRLRTEHEQRQQEDKADA